MLRSQCDYQIDEATYAEILRFLQSLFDLIVMYVPQHGMDPLLSLLG